MCSGYQSAGVSDYSVGMAGQQCQRSTSSHLFDSIPPHTRGVVDAFGGAVSFSSVVQGSTNQTPDTTFNTPNSQYSLGSDYAVLDGTVAATGVPAYAGQVAFLPDRRESSRDADAQTSFEQASTVRENLEWNKNQTAKAESLVYVLAEARDLHEYEAREVLSASY